MIILKLNVYFTRIFFNNINGPQKWDLKKIISAGNITLK